MKKQRLIVEGSSEGLRPDQNLEPGEALEIVKSKEKWLLRALIATGALILAYVYSSTLLAQQAAKQRVSVSQAVDFPNDI